MDILEIFKKNKNKEINYENIKIFFSRSLTVSLL